jgi:2-keto-4-pentenoate hydratase
MSTATTSPAVQAAARLSAAAVDGRPCAPVRDLIGSTDVDAAYAVQLLVNRERTRAGARIVGRKIGLTSPAVQAQLGVEQPDFGVLFDDMEYADGAAVPIGRLLQPKVEAEIAFVLGADLDDDDVSPDRVRAAVDHAVVALEIVDSRITDWDISFADTVADNASSGLFVLGTTRLDLADFEPRETTMTMSIDGEVVSTGTGEACLGDPLAALAWLAATARDLGEPLRAGQVVLSGALGPMAPVHAGARVSAQLTTTHRRPLGNVSTRFTESAQA